MKAILEFNLDDEDDRMAHLRCVKATDMAIVLFNIQQLNGEDFETVYDFIVRINDIYTDEDIKIHELIS